MFFFYKQVLNIYYGLLCYNKGYQNMILSKYYKQT